MTSEFLPYFFFHSLARFLEGFSVVLALGRRHLGTYHQYPLSEMSCRLWSWFIHTHPFCFTCWTLSAHLLSPFTVLYSISLPKWDHPCMFSSPSLCHPGAVRKTLLQHSGALRLCRAWWGWGGWTTSGSSLSLHAPCPLLLCYRYPSWWGSFLA